MVPVLSKAKTSALAICSNVSPPLTIIPRLEQRLIPETKAIGAARISGQGEATTNTSAKRLKSFDIYHARLAMIKDAMVNGTA